MAARAREPVGLIRSYGKTQMLTRFHGRLQAYDLKRRMLPDTETLDESYLLAIMRGVEAAAEKTADLKKLGYNYCNIELPSS